ncbi:Striatin-interacting protein 1 [Choanephora cucurbitarum]|uniref:Striatin-interacting protein 1 n=1 Tax=Choanephora cucurbitarum TaxID=101091 RepID=A0A1C7NG56_9FUNG|nr:Striatin-interacting protein 1 [Choanephora cucurbitarum]
MTMNSVYDDPLLTPGKLREHIQKLPSNKHYDYSKFNYQPDSDGFETELNEFLDSEDISDRFRLGQQLFQKEYNRNQTYDEWLNSPLEDRMNLILSLLAKLNHATHTRKLEISQILVYISFGPIQKGPECLFLHGQLLVSCGAFTVLLSQLELLKEIYLGSLPSSVDTNSHLYHEEMNAYITLIYLMIETQRYQIVSSNIHQQHHLGFRKEFLREPGLFSFLCQFMTNFETSSFNKTYQLPMKKFILLLWKSLLFESEGFKSLKKHQQRQLESLVAKDTLNKKEAVPCSPQGLLSFQEKTIKKYPHYQPTQLPSAIDPILWVNSSFLDALISSTHPIESKIDAKKESKRHTGVDHHPVHCKLDTPYSIQEADRVFQSRLYLSLADYQLLQVKQKYTQRWQHKEVKGKDHDELGISYPTILPYLQKTITLLLRLCFMSATAIISITDKENQQDTVHNKREKEIYLKAISALLLLLLKWTKSSHILKFEYVSQLLTDSGFLLLISKIMGSEELIYSVKDQKDTMAIFCSESTQGCSSSSNQRCIFWMINLVRITQMIVKHKVHSNMLLAQYKTIINHPILERYVLKLIKNQLPYLGKKWKGQNMKIISSIYLKSTSKLNDEWLSKTCLDEEEIENARIEQERIRLFTQLYHSEHYQPVSLSVVDRRLDISTESLMADPTDDAPVNRSGQSPPGTPFPTETPVLSPDQLTERINRLYLEQLETQFQPTQSPLKIGKTGQPKTPRQLTPLTRYQPEGNTSYLLRTFDLHTVMDEDWQLDTTETILSKLNLIEYGIIHEVTPCSIQEGS